MNNFKLIIMTISIAVCLSFSALADQEKKTLNNLAASDNGAKAWSNGDMFDRHYKVLLNANLAIDGIRYWYDKEGKPTGRGWMSKKEGKVTADNPAIWGVTFPKLQKVNRVKIYHIRGGLRLVDFSLEYQEPFTKKFMLVKPLDDKWKNPVRDNTMTLSDLHFKTVTTKRLRLVITKASPDVYSQARYKGGTAYIAEFEAYYESPEYLLVEKKRREQIISNIAVKSRLWQQEMTQEENQRLITKRRIESRQTLSPALKWVKDEKIRTAHTPTCTDKLIEYADQFKSMGLNSYMLAGWHWDARAKKVEPDLKRMDKMAGEKGFRLFLWTAWYWYPDDGKDWVDRNAFAYLGKDYRGDVNFVGEDLMPAPCPFDEALWKSITQQAIRSAKWSKKMHSIAGICFDFELYGAPDGRYWDNYTYDDCFCDDCFGKFLQAIGAEADVSDITPAERYTFLKKAGAIKAYYELLADRARQKAETLRKTVHKINPNFMFGFYGLFPPLGVVEKSLNDLPKHRFMASWFTKGLFEGLGTKQIPVLYVPLVTDPSRNPFETKKKDLMNYIKKQKLNVLYLPGYVIIPEQPSKLMQKMISDSLNIADGFWINELWMFWAYKENPKKTPPGWFSEQPDKKMESIDNYRKAISNAVRNWEKRKRK